MFRNGQTAFVNSNTNFVLVNQGRGTVQVAFNTVYPGPNGVTLKGVYLKQLFESIAARGGEGVSGVNLRITKSGKLLGATVAGKPVVDDKLYTVATIDYLADGNSDMTALIQAEKRDCPPGATLRGLFMDYVEQQTAAGKKITSRMEGRITVED